MVDGPNEEEGFSERLRTEVDRTDPAFAAILRENHHLPPDWLHWELLERLRVLARAGVDAGNRTLEVGAGAHAIATVPLAYLTGPAGHVVAVERERWTFFRDVVAAAGMTSRIALVASDARMLPFPSHTFDLAACIHGIRSLLSEENMVAVFQEMLRVADRLFLAESLPIARNEAQRAHLAMYNLREEIFEAVLGHKDDLRYRSLERLVALVEEAGGTVVESRVLDVRLPHFLAFIPREYVERIEDVATREDLLGRWERANELLEKHDAEHPPVGILVAKR